MDFINIPGRNRAEWLPEDCLQKALEGVDPESTKVIPKIEAALREQGFKIPPFFIEICISIASHEHAMTTIDPVIMQQVVHITYNNVELMMFLRESEKQEYIETIFKGRKTVASAIEAAKKMDTQST